MTQPASLDLMHQLAAELGGVGGPADEPKPHKVTNANLRDIARRRAHRQRFAEGLRSIVEPLYKAGYSYGRIAKALNEAGTGTLNGSSWTDEGVRLRLIPKLGLER